MASGSIATMRVDSQRSIGYVATMRWSCARAATVADVLSLSVIVRPGTCARNGSTESANAMRPKRNNLRLGPDARPVGQHRQKRHPGTDLVQVLFGHDARHLGDVPQVMHHPGSQQFP